MTKNNSTIDYYDNNAQLYVDNTIHANVQKDYDRFLSKLPHHGKILDVGSGSGRDSLYFKNLGYEIVAIDPSKGLAEKASELLGQKVLVMKAEDIPFQNAFDGIWAMSSLLHLTDDELVKAFSQCKKALKEKGSFFVSFRNRNDEVTDEKGRYFNAFNKDKIERLLSLEFQDIEIMEENDSLNRNQVSWLSVYAKPKPLNLVKKQKKSFKLK
jgi:SAM-dependent methyltransferase